MTWRTINLDCKSCGHEFEDTVRLSEQDLPYPCPDCGEKEAFRNPYRSINFMSPKRHMGKTDFYKDRSRQEAIEASKIKTEMLNLPQEKRTEHKKAIKKLTGEKL